MLSMHDWQTYLTWRDRFAEAMDGRHHTPGYLDAEVWSGRARFWASVDAAIVATLRVYPTGAREVHGLVAAGAVDGVRALIPAAERWGVDHGCSTASIESRAGWARVLRMNGYEPRQVTLRKDLR